MTIVQRAIDALRHPHEFPEQRHRRRWLAALASNDRPDLHPVLNTGARVVRVCLCSDTEDSHRVGRYTHDWPCLSCPCTRFRPARIQLEEAGP